MRLAKRILQRLLNAAGYVVIDTTEATRLRQALDDTRDGIIAMRGQVGGIGATLGQLELARELAETKGGVSAIQGQVGETLSHMVELRQEISRDLGATRGGVSAVQGQVGETLSHMVELRQEISRDLSATKGGVSAVQGQVGQTLSHIIALRQQLPPDLAEIKSGVSTVHGQVGESLSHIIALRHEIAGDGTIAADRRLRGGAIYPDLRDLPRRLDEMAARHLTCRKPEAGDQESGLAAHYADLACLVSRHWIRNGDAPADPYPDDDMSLDYARRVVAGAAPKDGVPDGHGPSLPWRHLWTDPDCAVLLVMGEALAGPQDRVPYPQRGEVYDLDMLNLCCRRIADRKDDAGAHGGGSWPQLGDLLIDNGLCRRVLLVPLGAGRSSITDWAPDGGAHPCTSLVLSRLRKELNSALLPFSAVLWQQAETDAGRQLLSAKTYTMHFHDIVADLRANGVFAPVFVACTAPAGEGAPEDDRSAAIRQAQRHLPAASSAIFAGPDVGTLAAVSSERAARLWCEVLSANRDALDKLA